MRSFDGSNLTISLTQVSSLCKPNGPAGLPIRLEWFGRLPGGICHLGRDPT